MLLLYKTIHKGELFMELTSCRRCNKLFITLRSRFCPECEKEIELSFIRVKNYLEDNPAVPLEKLSTETEVAKKLIYKFIEEGRLILTASSPITLSCKKCGEPIKKGRFCETCNQLLLDTISKPLSKTNEPTKKTSSRMLHKH